MPAEQGWRVVLAARSLERLEEIARELGGPEVALAVRCDVTEWEDQQRVVAAALETFGAIDAAFANAGFGGPRGFLKGTVEQWREMVLTNVYGAALTIRAMIPALSESRGHLLLTSSVAGRRVLPGSLYSVTKHAVTAMAEAARQDLDGTGVRVTADRARDDRHALFRSSAPRTRSPTTTSPARSCTRSRSRPTSTSTRY